MTDRIQNRCRVFSVGHSNHAMEKFLSLLELFDIDVLVDVRSHPHSKHAPQFASADLKRELSNCGIKYLYLGKELGGRPDDRGYYDDNGYVLYSEWARSAVFLEGIERLEHGIAKYKIAIMCSEENPTHCHRRLLITPVLIDRGIEVSHIRGDGALQPEADLLKLETHPTLFKSEEGIAWKSTRSVSQRNPRKNSSGF